MVWFLFNAVSIRIKSYGHILVNLHWMVPYLLSTDPQIINKLSVETLLTTVYGYSLGLVKVMFSEQQLERLNLNSKNPQ